MTAEPPDHAAERERAALARWLTRRLPGAEEVRIGAFGRPRSGYSAETVVLDADVVRAGRPEPVRLVLRREVPDPPVYPSQAPGLHVEIDIQWRAMSAVAAHSEVPVAPLVGYEADPGVLGAPFFVMGYVDGDVPTESPPYAVEGFFVEATPEQRHRMIEAGVRTMAALHAVDWQAAGLGWLVPDGATPGTAHQLSLWESFARQELGERSHPLLERAFDWLHDHLPADRTVGFAWGDPRPGNIIWQDFRVACVTDFEAVAIASPEQDLGWWLMFDRTMHPDGRRLPGDPTLAEQRAIYADATGSPVGDTSFHEVFAAARYCAIVVRVMNRLVARGALPADQTIWLDNPASACLGELLAEVG